MNLILAMKTIFDLKKKKKALKFADFCMPGISKERTMS